MPDPFGLEAVLRSARGTASPPPIPEIRPKRRRPLVLVGVGETAAMLGCSRQNVSKLAKRAQAGTSRSGFPAPHTVTSSGPVFDRRKIEDWIERRKP